jgi:hypothetical protein
MENFGLVCFGQLVNIAACSAPPLQSVLLLFLLVSSGTRFKGIHGLVQLYAGASMHDMLPSLLAVTEL